MQERAKVEAMSSHIASLNNAQSQNAQEAEAERRQASESFQFLREELQRSQQEQMRMNHYWNESMEAAASHARGDPELNRYIQGLVEENEFHRNAQQSLVNSYDGRHSEVCQERDQLDEEVQILQDMVHKLQQENHNRDQARGDSVPDGDGTANANEEGQAARKTGPV